MNRWWCMTHPESVARKMPRLEILVHSSTKMLHLKVLFPISFELWILFFCLCCVKAVLSHSSRAVLFSHQKTMFLVTFPNHLSVYGLTFKINHTLHRITKNIVHVNRSSINRLHKLFDRWGDVYLVSICTITIN